MDPAAITGWVTWAVEWAVAIVGSASLIAKGMQIIVAKTPGKGDDKFVAKLLGWIGSAEKVVGKIALNEPVKPK